MFLRPSSRGNTTGTCTAVGDSEVNEFLKCTRMSKSLEWCVPVSLVVPSALETMYEISRDNRCREAELYRHFILKVVRAIVQVCFLC